MNRFSHLAVVVALASVASTARAADAPPPAAVTVPIKSFAFMTMSVTVAAGGSVTWKNLDGEPHTVTGVDGSFRSAALDEDDTYSFTFAKPGVYKYLCTIHPKMTATVTVK